MAQYAGNLGTYLRVLYDYKYKGHDGADIEIHCGEECLLLKRTTAEWWYVLKQGDRKPIYVPSNYVEEFHKTVISVADSSEGGQPKTKRPAPEVPKKKKVPPKAPPKPAKLIRKPSDEDEVLKQLDNILEHAFDGEPIAEESGREQPLVGDKETKDSSQKRDSNHSSRTNSLQRNGDVFTALNEQKDSNDNKIKESTDDTSDDTTNLRTSPALVEPEPDYDISTSPSQTNDQSNGLQSPVSQSSDHAVDSGISEGSTECLDKKTDANEKSQESRDALEQDIPLDEKSYTEDEQPEYENFTYVQETMQRKSKQEDSLDDLPDYANLSDIQAKIFADPPPSEPPPGAPPVRSIDEWEEHKDIATGRSYYFNKVARDSTWHPPSCFSKKRESVPHSQAVNRRVVATNTFGVPIDIYPDYHDDTALADMGVSFTSGDEENSVSTTPAPVPVVNLPRGWTEEKTDEGTLFYVNEQTQEKWRSSVSPTGKTYFYNEVSGESLWELPELAPPEAEDADIVGDLQQEDTATMLRPRTKGKGKAGPLKRCKVSENGKKTSKSWGDTFAILGEGKLSLFKNQKAANPKSGAAKPESELLLAGATLEIAARDKKEKSKKPILSLTTANDTEFLLQFESQEQRNSWHEAIMSHIFPSQEEQVLMSAGERTSQESRSSLEGGSLDRKRKGNPASGRASPLAVGEELTHERTSRVRLFLYKWLFTRPSMESLREKGIIKDAVFGNHLHRVCDRDECNVPHFVTRVISAIEKRGLKTDGIYRISGNMAEIQKLRLLVDSGASYNLDSADWEVHVLTGALKMFFRELQEPLIPFTFYTKFLNANQVEKSSKVRAVRDLIKQMPPSNRETLRDLMVHLNKVIMNSSHNRMQAQNVAIVFGPTLMWPEDDTQHVAVSMVQSGQIVEYILQEQAKLFS